MAKINKTQVTENTTGKNTTPKGTLPPSQLKRFGMAANLGSSEFTGEDNYNKDWSSPNKRKWIRKMSRLVSNYRMMGACKTETKLPAPLRNSVRYFSQTMGGHGGGFVSKAEQTDPATEASTK